MPAESINIKQYDILFKILDTARKIAYAKQRGVEHLVNFDDIITEIANLVNEYERQK